MGTLLASVFKSGCIYCQYYKRVEWKMRSRSEFIPIPPGYALILSVWLNSPEQWLSISDIRARSRQSAYMHVSDMEKAGLLESCLIQYRPTKKGWIEYYDHEQYYAKDW